MRNRKMIVSVGSLFLLGFVLIYLGFSQVAPIVPSKSGTNLNVKVNSAKQNYIQGEVINLNFEINNDSSLDIPLKGVDVESGYLKIFVASADQKFKAYSNSAWGREKTKGIIIKVGQTVKSQAMILWNFSPVNRFSNLEGFEESHVMTDYAFPKSGTYFIKAVLYIPGETPNKIESEPIQVIIDEPVGDDLKVWNQIKDNGDIAYFLQQGRTPTYQDEKAEKLLKEVKQIAEKYPNSNLAGQMKQKLEKFRKDEEKRKEMLEKAKVKPEN